MLKAVLTLIGFAISILIAGFVFLWVISYPPFASDGPHTESNNSGTNADYQPPANSQRNATPIPPAIKLIPTQKSEAQTKRDEQESFQKAANERGLAVATWLIAFATVFLFVATGVLGVGTFIAALAAKRAAEHIPRVERAYVFGGATKIRVNDRRDKVIVIISMENVGKTPAVITKTHGEFSQEPPGPTPVYRPGSSAISFVLGAGDREVKHPDMWQDGFVGPQYFWGYITYDDIFGYSHTSRFCVQIFPNRDLDGKWLLAGTSAWNSWT